MKKLFYSLFVVLSTTSNYAQNAEMHNTQVRSSFELDTEEATAIKDDVTDCDRKTATHSKNSFNPIEPNQIKITKNKQMEEVIKTTLLEQFFTHKKYENNSNKAFEFDVDFKVNRSNIGDWHNRLIKSVYVDIENLGLTGEDLDYYIYNTDFISICLKEFCLDNNLQLPNDDVLTDLLKMYESISIDEVVNHLVFSNSQTKILKNSFKILEDNSLSSKDLIMDQLKGNLELLDQQKETEGKAIASAIVNQLISSTELWIIDGYSDKLPFTAKRPTNAELLGADGLAMGATLLFGGWTKPMGWYTSMFVGAGASIAKKIDSIWW